MRRIPAGQRGASLLEVLISTAVFAVVLGMAVPNLRAMSAPWALSGAANQLVADLQVARQRAIARNARYRITFTAPRSYVLEVETSPNTFVADTAVQKLPAAATLGTVNPGNPVFDTRGMLTATVTLSVTVPYAGTRTVTINVLGKTTVS
ncbi:MAG: hypothetical protein E6J56_05080 [Deltaproteobacteria bacterium]|nr:MAG: hypothetical protein E6J56_05080 [Deltaproteobacteria bacterium]